MKAPTMDEWAEKIGTIALNGFEYNGRTLREWIDLMASGYCVVLPDGATNGDVIRALFDDRGYLALKDRMEHTMWWNTKYKGDDTDENN